MTGLKGVMANNPVNNPSIWKAALWMSGTLLSFTFMAIAIRELHAAEIHTFEMLAMRSIVGLAIVLVVAWRFGWHLIRTQQLKLQIGRNIVHFGGQSTWMYGLSLLPLAEVFAIEFTIPIWVAILAVCFLGERITKSRLIAIGFGFAGILVMLKPGLEVIDSGAFVVMASAFFFGLAITSTKKLVTTDGPLAVLFFMCLIQLPMGLIPAVFVWITPQGIEWLFLLFIGLMGLSAHYCEAHAFRHADATVVIPLQFLRLPLIAIVGFFLYKETLDWTVLLGALMIFGGNYYNIRQEAGRSGG